MSRMIGEMIGEERGRRYGEKEPGRRYEEAYDNVYMRNISGGGVYEE
jgi:hypothetical protein